LQKIFVLVRKKSGYSTEIVGILLKFFEEYIIHLDFLKMTTLLRFYRSNVYGSANPISLRLRRKTINGKWYLNKLGFLDRLRNMRYLCSPIGLTEKWKISGYDFDPKSIFHQNFK